VCQCLPRANNALTLILGGLLVGACHLTRDADREKAEQTAEQIEAAARQAAETERLAKISLEYPLHGAVTGTQPTLREQPTAESLPVGWLRVGSHVRLARGIVKSATCNSGWYRIYPRGWACAGEGLQVTAHAPPSVVTDGASPDPGLPYFYYLVKESLVPAYHRLPPREDQRFAESFAEKILELKKENEEKAKRLLAGELPGDVQKPAIVAKYLDRGFFVAGDGTEIRASRRFVHSVRGQYIKLSQLQERHGSRFHGVELGKGRSLPVGWVVRGAQPFWVKMRPDGTLRFVSDPTAAPIPRLTELAFVKRARIGDQIFYRIEDGRYLRYWYVAVAEQVDPPKGVKADDTWVHVSLGQQTLVVYRGKQPIYATLVSTGLDGYETPVGTFYIREKYIAETMSDLGPDAGDSRYKIEDVPWTQYFSGSFALHGAFWHEGFGLRRSHGCINLSPLDARWIFERTLPLLPEGWHGITTDKTGLTGSLILVTK
jgi:hypothetical protein